MLFRRHHLGNSECGKTFRRIVNTFHLEAQHRQGIKNVIQRVIGFKMVKQPATGKFHQTLPPARPA